MKLCFVGCACLAAGLGAVGRAAEVPQFTDRPPAGTVLALAALSNGKEQYAGSNYVWLGENDLELTIAVAPGAGRALDLLWGSKRDERSAVLEINGQTRNLAGGGHDGFRWMRVPIGDEVTGTAYALKFKAGSTGRPAFLSAVCLTATTGTVPEGPRSLFPIKVNLLPATGARAGGLGAEQAFPEMRVLWTQPAPASAVPQTDETLTALLFHAENNGRRNAEALYRCRRFVLGWLENHSDPKTGLFPRNLGQNRDLWNAKDCAADNYPFMVLTCALTDRPMFEGRLLEMLRTEERLTSRLGRMPDDYSFSKQGFARETPDLEAIIFGGAEYVKDGLIPLTEWLGPSPWSERMIGIVDDIWAHAPIDTPNGKIPTLNFEVNGDLLQACSRLYWFTGERKYLEWALRLGDYYLLGNQHPTRDQDRLHLLDHGCEAINGLTELYVATGYAAPEKKKAYQKPLHEMFDTILAKGRNEHGMLYGWFNPKTDEHHPQVCDTWGYDYDGVYTVYLVDGRQDYREAVRKALGNLKLHYLNYRWLGGVADGYADSIEGGLNLYNRERLESAADWVDGHIQVMWAIQKSDGVIEGWHGDGNFARTTIMYALWKSQGLTVQPWREDVRVGAVPVGTRLVISLAAEQPWEGRLIFDQPRHKTIMRLPLDYPRINQFPEWYTVETARRYLVHEIDRNKRSRHEGAELIRGLELHLKANEYRWLTVEAL